MVCPLSLWYVQYKFWFLRDGSPPILFGHLKNNLFLIRSRILCTGSLNATLTPSICASGSYILKSFFGLARIMPYQDLPSNGAFPLFCSRSSSRCLYPSMHLISCLISSGGIFINDSHNSESLGSPILKVLAAIFSFPPPISL